MKGLLRGSDGTIFHLMPRVTTIGKEGCNLAIQSNSVESQHAVIEHNEQKEWFVLQDLGTTLGTSVNQCRVQNAAVRLQPGDLIKFGDHSTLYEFGINGQNQVIRPPAYPCLAWSSPNVTETTSILTDQKVILPNRQSGVSTLPQWPTAPGHGSVGSNISPHPPPSTKALSLSSGMRRGSIEVPPKPAPLKEFLAIDVHQSTPDTVLGKSGLQIEQLQQHLKILTEELKHLAGIEMNAHKKDELISELKDEIAVLQRRLRQAETGIVDVASTEVRQKLIQLEKEVHRGSLETKHLKSQLNQIRPAVTTSPYHINCTSTRANVSSISSRSQPGKQKPPPSVLQKTESGDASGLLADIEHLKKDKNVTLGLLAHLQKDMANKDVSISHLTKEIEELKKELSVKDSHIVSLKGKVQPTDCTKKEKDALEFKDREIALLQYKLRLAESEKSDLNNRLLSTIKDLTESKAAVNSIKQQMIKTKTESETLTRKHQDLEHAERLVRVAMDQISKKLEHLRNNVIQTAYSYPGAKTPEQHLDDDEVLAALKTFAEQYAGLLKRNQLLERKQDIEKIIAENTRKLKEQFMETVSQLRSKGPQTRHIKAEIERIKAVPITENFLSDIKDVFLTYLRLMLNWQKEIEEAMDKCSVKFINDGPSQCISELLSKHQEAQAEIVNLQAKLNVADDQVNKQVKKALDLLRVDLESKHKDEVERIRHEDEVKLIQVENEAKNVNQEFIDRAVEMEKHKTLELEKTVELLKLNLKERENTSEVLRTQAIGSAESLEASKRNEADLRENLKQLESAHGRETDNMTRKLERLNAELKGHEKEEHNLKEELKNHVLTICALEERLDAAVKKNKELQVETVRLETKTTDLEGKLAKTVPTLDPHPVILQPLADEAAMEQLLRDNKELSQRLQEQHNIILTLRRDLAGAHARLSDLTAEVSDAQKMALEKGNVKIREQEAELLQLHQQMAQLSDIVDKQTNEIKDLNSSLSKEKEVVGNCRMEISKKNAELSILQDAAAEKDKRRTSSQNLDSTANQEERLSSELQSLGAQCKGERHLQIIERQGEALAEMRGRLKVRSGTETLQESSLDQTLKQVLTLQKEFEGLRTSQALASTVDGDEEPAYASTNEAKQIRQIDFASKAQLDMERSAHFETQKSLEISERTYMMLVRTLTEALNIENDFSLKTVAHLSLAEGEQLAEERNSICERILNQLKSLNKRLERKDELLQGYDGDLSRIRDAHDFVTYNSKKAETLNDEIRLLKEEIQCLQDSLVRVKEQLEKEKRLNSYIKQKKTFHLEKEFSVKNGWPRHQCLQPDSASKLRKKSSQSESAKKGEEIKLLKLEGTKFQPLPENSDFKLIAVDI